MTTAFDDYGARWRWNVGGIGPDFQTSSNGLWSRGQGEIIYLDGGCTGNQYTALRVFSSQIGELLKILHMLDKRFPSNRTATMI